MSAAAPRSSSQDGGAASMSEESTRTATPVHPFFLASGAKDGSGPVDGPRESVGICSASWV